MTGAYRIIRDWPGLPAAELEDLEGDLRGEFVAPLRRVAPFGLGLLGLPRWHGKRFARSGSQELSGFNLLRRRNRSAPFEERVQMRAVRGQGLADGRPALVITYASDAPRPWRWVRDEVRGGADGGLVAMSYVDLPVLRRGGLPFLLHREG